MLLRFLTTPILLSFHLHHDVAVTAGVYTIWSQAGFLFDVWYNSIKEYYAAQQITMPAAVVDAIFVVVNFLLTCGSLPSEGRHHWCSLGFLYSETSTILGVEVSQIWLWINTYKYHF